MGSLLPLQGNKPFSYLNSTFNESEGLFSPDGRWVAYRSDDSGRSEVYVQPFPPSAEGGGKLQVSDGGGEQPRWRRDGKEILYVAGDRTLMLWVIERDLASRACSISLRFWNGV